MYRDIERGGGGRRANCPGKERGKVRRKKG